MEKKLESQQTMLSRSSFRFFVLFSLGSFKCGVGGGRWAPYDRYVSYPAKILEKGCLTWPDNRGCTVYSNAFVTAPFSVVCCANRRRWTDGDARKKQNTSLLHGLARTHAAISTREDQPLHLPRRPPGLSRGWGSIWATVSVRSSPIALISRGIPGIFSPRPSASGRRRRSSSCGRAPSSRRRTPSRRRISSALGRNASSGRRSSAAWGWRAAGRRGTLPPGPEVLPEAAAKKMSERLGGLHGSRRCSGLVLQAWASEDLGSPFLKFLAH